MKLKEVVRCAMLGAISVILVYLIHFPIIPAAPFLEYDPADISLIIAGLAYGPYTGIILTAVVSIVQGITVSAGSGWIGILMHILSTSSCVAAASIVYKKTNRLYTALIIGAVTMVVIMIPLNLVFTGIFMGAGTSTVAKMLIPAIIPFNIFKAGVNSIITAITYKRTERFM